MNQSVLYLNDLVVQAKHGVHQHEKEQLQTFVVSVQLYVDITQAGVSDDLNDTLDWSLIRQQVIDTVQNNSFNLMERLTYEVANQLLADGRVHRVIVTIDKPEAFESGVPGVRVDVAR